MLSEKVKQYIYRQPIVTLDSSSIVAYHMAAVVEKNPVVLWSKHKPLNNHEITCIKPPSYRA